MRTFSNHRSISCGALLALLILGSTPGVVAAEPSWPDVFDPSVVLILNLQMSSGDWATVQGDTSNSIQVPAQFWANGETAISVTVRRKSSAPVSGSGFSKVGLSIDFNAVVLGQEWNELKKLNLESGDGASVLFEGFSWQLVTLASGVQGFGYQPSQASWVQLFINSVDTGVYINVEKVDKRFLENRDLFVVGQS